MKCKAKLIYCTNKKGVRKIFGTLPPNCNREEAFAWFDRIQTQSRNKLDMLADNGEMWECQGKVKAHIVAEDEPYMGGSSAVLRVTFRCDTCGHTNYPNLPDEYNVDEWINGILDNNLLEV
jgi:hypothetical protein